MLSRFFLDRPVFAWVIAIILMVLGGIALVRNFVLPGHAVSWAFAGAGDEERVAILVPRALPDHVSVSAYNLDSKPVKATHLPQGDTPKRPSAPFQSVSISASPPSAACCCHSCGF